MVPSLKRQEYSMLSRRDLLRSGLFAAGALSFGRLFWSHAFADSPAFPGDGPYGPPGAADANGIRLPAGFSARQIARGGQWVPGTTYNWHPASDGQATFWTADGGWILVSNSESLPFLGGGASAIEFGPDGSIRRAYRILQGTTANCSGGATPWGTWMSCEE